MHAVYVIIFQQSLFTGSTYVNAFVWQYRTNMGN